MCIAGMKMIIELFQCKKDVFDPFTKYIHHSSLTHGRALGKIKMARESGKFTTRKKYEIISKYTKEAEVAREFIPRLNMHGLWIAK